MVEAKETERTNRTSEHSGEAATVESVARKVGSAIGGIVSKVSGAQTSGDATSVKPLRPATSQSSHPSSNAYESRRHEMKKKKKTAHRRRLKASNTKG